MAGAMDETQAPAGTASTPLELRHAATDHAVIVVVPERRLLAIDGVGDPRGNDFRHATTILRSVGERLRVRVPRDRTNDAPGGGLEVAWWIHPEVPPDEMAASFADRSSWHWQQMLEVPHFATDADAMAVIDEARTAAGGGWPLVRLIRFTEGTAAQILHVAGSGDEADSIRKLFSAVASAGRRARGHVHQIILADPDFVPAERARSIFRLPIEPH
jgi:hypothetical protein